MLLLPVMMNLSSNRVRRRFAAALLFLAGWSLSLMRADAELTWANKFAELKADAKTATLEARFHFTNTGRQPVDVRQIESSCGCTTAELTQRHYAPGESGDIVARYTVGSHVGRQDKTIAVFTNDREAPTTLTLSIQIPEVLRIAPPFVAWKHAEDAKTKTITLEQLQEAPVEDISVQSSNAGISVALQTLAKGRKYRLDVTPAQTAQTSFATLTIRCRYGEEEKTYRAYATVKPAQAAE